MTTPPPDEPAETVPAASAPPPSPPAAPPAPAAALPPAQPAAENPVFAPVPRAPRVPWVNPARRSHVVGAAVIGTVVALGAGFGIGFAVAPSDNDHHRPYDMYRNGYGPGMRGHLGWYPARGQMLVPGKGMYQLPPGATAPPATPSPSTPSPSNS
jgi:hypothetical protein